MLRKTLEKRNEKPVTGLEKAKLSELLAQIEKNKSDLAPKLEILYRVIERNTDKELLTQAKTICADLLKTFPNNHFYNFVWSLFEKDQKKRAAHLFKAAQPVPRQDGMGILRGKDNIKAINVDATFELAKIFIGQKQHVEAHAFAMRAMVLGSEEAQVNFLGSISATGNNYLNYSDFDLLANSKMIQGPRGNYQSNNKQNDTHALAQSVWLAISLSFKDAEDKLSQFNGRSWILGWRNAETERALTEAYYQSQSHVKIEKLAKLAINNNAYIFHDYFMYCWENKFIADEHYEKVMEIFLKEKSTDQKLCDLAHYSLYKFYMTTAKENSAGEKAVQHFEAISLKFKDYKITDVEILKYKGDRDSIKYTIFKKLYEGGHYHEAFTFLNSIEDAEKLDETVLDFFAKAEKQDIDGKKNEFGYLASYKPSFLSKLSSSESSTIQERLATENQQSTSDQVLGNFKKVIGVLNQYLIDRENRINTSSTGTKISMILFSGDRDTFQSELKKLEIKDTHDLATLQSYQKKLKEFVATWSVKIKGKETTVAFDQAQGLLDVAEILLKQLNEEASFALIQQLSLEDKGKPVSLEQQNLDSETLQLIQQLQAQENPETNDESVLAELRKQYGDDSEAWKAFEKTSVKPEHKELHPSTDAPFMPDGQYAPPPYPHQQPQTQPLPYPATSLYPFSMFAQPSASLPPGYHPWQAMEQQRFMQQQSMHMQQQSMQPQPFYPPMQQELLQQSLVQPPMTGFYDAPPIDSTQSQVNPQPSKPVANGNLIDFDEPTPPHEQQPQFYYPTSNGFPYLTFQHSNQISPSEMPTNNQSNFSRMRPNGGGQDG